jgi:hypothetical protein
MARRLRHHVRGGWQLIRSTATGAPDTLYEYNDLGEQFRSGTDVNNNGRLDLAGPDRVSET